MEQNDAKQDRESLLDVRADGDGQRSSHFVRLKPDDIQQEGCGGIDEQSCAKGTGELAFCVSGAEAVGFSGHECIENALN